MSPLYQDPVNGFEAIVQKASASQTKQSNRIWLVKTAFPVAIRR